MTAVGNEGVVLVVQPAGDVLADESGTFLGVFLDDRSLDVGLEVVFGLYLVFSADKLVFHGECD